MKKPDPDDPSKKILDYVEPAGKSLLSNAGKFLEMLQEFDKDNIPDKVRFEVSLSSLGPVGHGATAGHQEGRPLHREPGLHAQDDREGERRVQGHLHVVRRGVPFTRDHRNDAVDGFFAEEAARPFRTGRGSLAKPL